MTPFQFRMLHYISTHDVLQEHLKAFRQGTLGSLLQHQWVVSDSKGRIWPTRVGTDRMAEYQETGAPTRKNADDLTARVQNMLKLVRMRRSA